MASTPHARQVQKEFGQRLRGIRQRAGLTARALAAAADWHESKCSRIENGHTTPSDQDIRVWARLCGAENEVDDLIATARGIEGMYVEWQRLTGTGLRRVQENALPLHERTRRFRIYEPGVVPGLLQTPDYARALMGAIIAFRGIPDDTERAVDARMARQKVLHSGDRRFAVLMEESALRARIGGPDVMAAQLGHLLVAASFPRVSLGIIPGSADRSMWPIEGFWVFDRNRVLVELVTAEVTITQPREIAVYLRSFTALAEMAVYGKAARRCITEAIDALG
ncbi:DUF5753 domain-containing protein [Streptomyces sp. NPDC049881]|uniref:DUF5753 domain-containing protein n=1 Tax=Streptomyces sp. NPDC049881 TaxID=3155778 RepID=UPI0034262A70